jgi:hypothetical protein
VRAQVYRLLVSGARSVDADAISGSRSWDTGEVEASLRRLHAEHRLLIDEGSLTVLMAHPFSGVETGFRAVVGSRSWNSNCAWDSLALLALLGDGEAVVGDLTWKVVNGMVEPDGVIHLLVPARSFWDDVGFT